MSTLRSSENYVWSTHDVLGQGATAAVYKARHKRTGMLFAVKTFNQKSHMRPLEVQMREFDVMLKLNHENIVKLLAIEEEVTSHSKMLVMELCTGGSLYSMLDEPSNAFGLEETEFLTVVRDVAGGMKHLRDQGIIHRDIKPGNIMRYISEDGRAIYKLTDFGAARELEEEEQFMSLYGTEEYLHPDLYERAVLRRPMSGPFAATVDLWSLGVTFYHVAAGQLPFRPFGGRRNRETMYMITTEKESGVISGVQHSENGQIEWSRDMPRHCRLSVGARRMLVPLLAGLMECVQSRMWTFDQFFQEVHDIVTKYRIYVFNVGTASLLNIYLDPKEKYAKLCEEIASQTDVPANRQVLFYNNSLLVKQINQLQSVDAIRGTTPDNPILLFRNEHSDFDRCPLYDIPPFPPMVTNQIVLDRDYKDAKATCGILYLIERYVAIITQSRQYFNKAVATYLFGLRNEIEQVRQQVSQFEVICRETDHRTTYFANSHMMQRQLVELYLNTLPDADIATSKEEIRQFLDVLEKRAFDHQTALAEVYHGVKNMKKYADDYQQRVVICRDLEKTWRDTSYDIEQDRYVERMEGPLRNARQIMVDFGRDRSMKRMPFNEEQIHIFNKMRMHDICSGAVSIFECCTHNLGRDFEEYQKWFKTASTVRVKLCRLQSQVRTLADRHMHAAGQLDKAMAEHHRKMQSLVNQLEHRQNDRPLTLNTLNSDSLSSSLTSSNSFTPSAPTTTSSSSPPSVTVSESITTQVDQYVQVSPPPPERPPRSSKIASINKGLLQQINQNLISLQMDSNTIKDVVQENADLLKQLEELSFPPPFLSTDSGMESV